MAADTNSCRTLSSAAVVEIPVPAPQGTDACCVKDADAKAAGRSGCGTVA